MRMPALIAFFGVFRDRMIERGFWVLVIFGWSSEIDGTWRTVAVGR